MHISRAFTRSRRKTTVACSVMCTPIMQHGRHVYVCVCEMAHVCVCVCVCVNAHVCVCVCVCV